jgi:hypothetical protein
MHFRFPNIDTFSFLLGIILSTLAWWFISILRPLIIQLRSTVQAKNKEPKRTVHPYTGLEERYRQRVLLHAQGLHLAAPIFSLDEILIPPVLLAPPPRVEPGTSIISEDIVTATLPYLPNWPEIAAIYCAPTLTIAQALSGNSDIVLTGQAGMGKTVALAYLASRLARKDPEPGFPLETLPILIHIADLDLPIQKDTPLKSLIGKISEKTSVLDLPRFPDFIHKAFSDGRALLLLDGADELAPDGLKDAIEFIKGIKRSYPNTRIVTTASNEYLDGLVTLNFIPFSLAAWNSKQRMQFIEKWGDRWIQYVSVETWNQTNENVDPLLLNNWLDSENNFPTPLELTLKTWNAYAGDIRGPGVLDSIETHLRRLVPKNASRESLEILALQIILRKEPIFTSRKARDWMKSFESSDIFISPEIEAEASITKTEINQVPSFGLISQMLENSLLIHHTNNRLRFIHPIFCAYLAGRALIKNKSEVLLDQPPWIGKFLALNFLAASGDATPLVAKLLSEVDRPLSRFLLIPARWLRDAPQHLPWRGHVISNLLNLLRQTGLPLGLRGQVICAFVQSGDPSVLVIFRNLLEEHDNDLLQLAALGSGALQDIKAINLLAALLGNQSPIVRRAACLALVNIGTTASLDLIASSLLHGDENLRRAAAEALANHSSEGHAMLKEGAGMKDDLLVRRSVIYGLGRILEPWAEELITDLETKDDQWAVRNAALEVTENRQRPNPHIPQRLPPPTESPWIIAFAGKQGLGVAPDKPPVDLLLLALKSGTEEEQLASLAYLKIFPTEGVFGALYRAMYSGNPTLRESVYITLSEMAARGLDVPDSAQFGVG